MPIPPIATLTFEPDASVSSVSLTIGARALRTRDANRELVPSSCPPGGFPFAAEFTYADGQRQHPDNGPDHARTYGQRPAASLMTPEKRKRGGKMNHSEGR